MADKDIDLNEGTRRRNLRPMPGNLLTPGSVGDVVAKQWAALEGQVVRVHTRSGATYRAVLVGMDASDLLLGEPPETRLYEGVLTPLPNRLVLFPRTAIEWVCENIEK